MPPPPRAIGRLVRTTVGKESAASPRLTALLPCVPLHTCPPQVLLISPAPAASGRCTVAYCRRATAEATSTGWAIRLGHWASRMVLGARPNAREVLLVGSLRRLSASTARTVSPVAVRCRPRPEQTGHDVGCRPALSGLSNRPLSTRRQPVACQAAARLAACSYCSDSLHFAVCLDLLCCCRRRLPGGFEELSADLELRDDARGVPVSDRHRGLTRVGADRRERGAAPC